MQSLDRGTPLDRGIIPRSSGPSSAQDLLVATTNGRLRRGPGLQPIAAPETAEAIAELRSAEVEAWPAPAEAMPEAELAAHEFSRALFEVGLDLVRLRFRQPSCIDGGVDLLLRRRDECLYE